MLNGTTLDSKRNDIAGDLEGFLGEPPVAPNYEIRRRLEFFSTDILHYI